MRRPEGREEKEGEGVGRGGEGLERGGLEVRGQGRKEKEGEGVRRGDSDPSMYDVSFLVIGFFGYLLHGKQTEGLHVSNKCPADQTSFYWCLPSASDQLLIQDANIGHKGLVIFINMG